MQVLLSRKALAGIALFAATAPAPLFAQAVLEGSGEESTIDCGGGAAEVTGTSNHVTVEGACSSLKVEGSGNVVMADMAERSSITVTGTSNAVTWRAPGKAVPKTRSAGVGNSIRRAE